MIDYDNNETHYSYSVLKDKWLAVTHRTPVTCLNPDVTVDDFWDCYQGSFDTWTDWAKAHLRQHSAWMDARAADYLAYFDYDAFAQDMRRDGRYYAIDHEDQIAVFSTVPNPVCWSATYG